MYLVLYITFSWLSTRLHNFSKASGLLIFSIDFSSFVMMLGLSIKRGIASSIFNSLFIFMLALCDIKYNKLSYSCWARVSSAKRSLFAFNDSVTVTPPHFPIMQSLANTQTIWKQMKLSRSQQQTLKY